MTDDRVAGLPDAGTIQPGDPGHIETHDRMAELMQFAAERIGVILDPPAPKPAVIGEYGHVDAHNTLLANIEQIAREAGTAVGGPPAPFLTNPEGGAVVAFTSGGEGAGGPTIAYGAEIEPNDHGETVTVRWDDPLVGGEVSVSGTSPFTDYIVTVYGVNIAGRGESATTDAFQLNYNEATGGDEVATFEVTQELLDADPLLGEVGAVWKYHWFKTNGTFTAKGNSQPFRYMMVGGGRAGGHSCNSGGGKGGAGGALVFDDAAVLPNGDIVFTQGNGGAANNNCANGNYAGTDSTLSGAATVTTTGGSTTGKASWLTGSLDWGFGGKGGTGGGCANSFGVRAGCGTLGAQAWGAGKGACGGAANPCTDCGGGCVDCAPGHGALNGYGGGGGGSGACSGGGGGHGSKGGFIVAYQVAQMETPFVREIGNMDAGWVDSSEAITLIDALALAEVDDAIEAAALADETKPKSTRKKS